MGNKEKIIIASIAGIVILCVILIFMFGMKPPSAHQYNMNLEVWGFDDDGDILRPIFDNYKKLDPNIKEITYRKLTVDTYKKELIDALAAGQGPDIFIIHNTWLPGFSDKIVPASAGIITEQAYRNNFPDVAVADFIKDGQIYAAPLSVDSLGLYYNKDLFNVAGITSPPTNWDDFVSDVRKLTKISSSGAIEQSGVSLGTNSSNINRATDVLNLLMMQKGFAMPTPGSTDYPDMLSGESALNFYTQFASSSSPNYSWNSAMHYSIDAFSEGKLAMMFNYSWHIKTISGKSPKLNYGVAAIPQFPGSTPVNYANYWAFAVAKNKTIVQDSNTSTPPVNNETRIKEAWKLLVYLTTKGQASGSAATTTSSSPASATLGNSYDPNFDPAASYINATGKPAARRDLIETQKTNPMLGAFAQGNLIDKSWVQKEPESNDGALDNMISQVNKGQATISEALKTAVQRITQLQELNELNNQ